MAVGAGDGGELAKRLRTCDEQELEQLVRERGDELDPGAVRQALRNPFVNRRVIEALLAQPRLLAHHEVTRAIASHPRTPENRALNLVPALYWADLVKLGADTRLGPRLRRAADQRLVRRLPALALGERIAIARGAGVGVISRLRHDPHPAVIGALLENPRLTHALLAPLVNGDGARPEILALVAADRRWGQQRAVRSAIARNPRTPEATALGLMSSLGKADLREVAGDRRIAAGVRRRAETLLGRQPI